MGPSKDLNRVSARDLDGRLQIREAEAYRLEDDGVIPNHPCWPLLVYQEALRLAGHPDPAGLFEKLFRANGWGRSWRNGIYRYVHYHSAIHEVLGIARGAGEVRFGGSHGRTLAVKAGDVAILPAGTGHQLLEASGDFLVVGAYPPEGVLDQCTRAEDHSRSVKTIPAVPTPQTDPVYGVAGALVGAWPAP